MEQKTNIHRLIVYGGIFCLLIFPFVISGQTIVRQSISSYAASGSVNGKLIAQTAGQSFSTTTNSKSGKNLVLQGFQQNSQLELIPINPHEVDAFNLDIYPNPAINMVKIHNKDSDDVLSIRVLDTRGRIHQTQELHNVSEYNLQCQDWKSGIYFIHVSNEERKEQVYKLIITK